MRKTKLIPPSKFISLLTVWGTHKNTSILLLRMAWMDGVLLIMVI